MSNCCDSKTSCSASATVPVADTVDNQPNTPSLHYRIQAMDCPTEEALIRNKLSKLPGVHQLDFNLVQRVLTVHIENIEPVVIEAHLHELGFVPEKIEPSTKPQDTHAPESDAPPVGLLAVSGVAAVVAEMLEFSGRGEPVWVAALALIAIACGGWKTYQKGWVALKNRILNINALMSIAVTGAVLIGQWPEAAMVTFLFAVAELIEAKSIDRARHAIRGLMELSPASVTVQQPGGDWQVMAVDRVPMGGIVRVRPGERIGLDGEVVTGRSAVNQAPITGESLPVDKGPGDQVFAGSINEAGAFEFRVTAAAQDTTLARIIHAIENAQGARAPTQRFVDEFAKIYTPVVFVLAVLVAIIPPLFFAGNVYEWIYKALVLLVIACPCALVISTPVTVVSGLAAAARRGILIKGGVYLERGRHLHTIALDKTGTLTQGKPVQTDSVALRDNLAQSHQDPQVINTHAVSLAARSDHPVSRALVDAAPSTLAVTGVDEFSALPGQGIKGKIDGTEVFLGNHRLIENLGVCSPAIEERLDQWEKQGKSVVMFANRSQVLMQYAVADAVKPTSRDAIEQLTKLGITTVMLTGDNIQTAQTIAQQVGISTVHGNLLPEDKLKLITELINTKGNGVGMVGDGINDAPALARADIAFAMGAAGTDTAIETADVALMDDDLRKIPEFIRLSRRTSWILKQNIVAALGIKAIFMVLTFMGSATLWMAVFADVGASLLVVGNGLRLLRSPQMRGH